MGRAEGRVGAGKVGVGTRRVHPRMQSLVTCAKALEMQRKEIVREGRTGSVSVNGSAPKRSSFLSLCWVLYTSCELVTTFVCSFLVCFGASKQPMFPPGSREINITVETNSLDSTYSGLTAHDFPA